MASPEARIWGLEQAVHLLHETNINLAYLILDLMPTETVKKAALREQLKLLEAQASKKP